MSEYYLIILFFILVFIFGGMIARHFEKKEWNNGVCKITYRPWKNFDMDSQGGRGYTDGCGNYCWMSYNVDKIRG